MPLANELMVHFQISPVQCHFLEDKSTEYMEL